MVTKEIYKKLNEMEKYFAEIKSAYEKMILKKAETEDLKIRLREVLATEELSEQQRIKGEKAYNQLVRAINRYEGSVENFKRSIENVSREISKLRELVVGKKEIEKIKPHKRLEVLLSIFVMFIFLAALNYFKILHEAQKIVGYAPLPSFSLTFSHLLIGSVTFLLLIFLLIPKRSSAKRKQMK